MKHTFHLLLASVALSSLALVSCTPKTSVVASDFAFADGQLRIALQCADSIRTAQGKTLVELPSPRNIEPDNSMRLVPASDWCSGFFPGELWYMYEYTGDPFWKQQAETYTEALESQKSNRGTHDIGFMMYCSFGNGQRLAPNDHYQAVLLKSARSLASRFNPTTGCIRSWDNWGPTFPWQYPVIIDNMMNLELLFWATQATGDSTFYKIAVTHADTTMKNHFRPDYSSYHVVDYDTVSGKRIAQQTHQGYADSSAWARGQAWGLYGYTVCYRETKDPKYLGQADRIAAYILSRSNQTADMIPYWDYDAPNIPNEPRDVSAATVTASALYELSTYSADSVKYRAMADSIINNLSKSYLVKPGTMHGFLLRSSTGHKPNGSEIDVPIVYADYYFLEALLRKERLATGQPVVGGVLTRK